MCRHLYDIEVIRILFATLIVELFHQAAVSDQKLSLSVYGLIRRLFASLAFIVDENFFAERTFHKLGLFVAIRYSREVLKFVASLPMRDR